MRIGMLLWAVAALGAAGTATAQYKVIGPDGRVTYTDRPPVTEDGKVTNLGRAGSGGAAPAATAAEGSLPFELRQVVARYPVILYAGASCAPCDAARRLLQERGIPYNERQIVTDEDTAALERLSGGRTIPSLGVGAQVLRGFSPTDWAGYLDVAGYPRDSRLPRGWRPAPPAPLVARAAVAPPSAPAPAEPAARAPALPPADAASPAIRF